MINFLAKIFRTIWGIWGLFLLVLACVIVGPFHMILGPLLGERAAKFLMFITYRLAARMILYPSLIFIKNHGRDKIDKNTPSIVVGNHRSNLDFMVNPHTAPMYIRVLVKKELERVPIFGSVMKAISISVDRGDKVSRKDSFRKLHEKLKAGYSVFLYPEGTRNRSDQPLGEFKSGAFRMAIEAGLPLVVTTIANVTDINDIRRKLPDLRPGTLHVYWDGPIDTSGMTLDDVPRLMEQARQIMEGHILKHQAPSA